LPRGVAVRVRPPVPLNISKKLTEMWAFFVSGLPAPVYFRAYRLVRLS